MYNIKYHNKYTDWCCMFCSAFLPLPHSCMGNLLFVFQGVISSEEYYEPEDFHLNPTLTLARDDTMNLFHISGGSQKQKLTYG